MSPRVFLYLCLPILIPAFCWTVLPFAQIPEEAIVVEYDDAGVEGHWWVGIASKARIFSASPAFAEVPDAATETINGQEYAAAWRYRPGTGQCFLLYVGWREICSVEREYAHAAISLWQWDRHCDAALGDGDDYPCRRTDTGQDCNSDGFSLSYSDE